MPYRNAAAQELAALLAVLAHPHRLRLVEELGSGERDVAGLQQLLGVSQAAASQHLATLRAHRLVAERREGRHVYYHLVDPRLASWLLKGFDVLAERFTQDQATAAAITRARRAWEGRR